MFARVTASDTCTYRVNLVAIGVYCVSAPRSYARAPCSYVRGSRAFPGHISARSEDINFWCRIRKLGVSKLTTPLYAAGVKTYLCQFRTISLHY